MSGVNEAIKRKTGERQPVITHGIFRMYTEGSEACLGQSERHLCEDSPKEVLGSPSEATLVVQELKDLTRH